MITINILGTEYTVEVKKISEDNYMEQGHLAGYCCEESKRIIIADMSEDKFFPNMTKNEKRVYRNSTTRHEVVHAFLNESGLSGNSSIPSCGWAKHEEMVDWFAIQSPKIFKVFMDLGVMEGYTSGEIKSVTEETLHIKDYIAEVGKNATDHGFRNVNTNLTNFIALIHSEVSEVLEEFRKGKEPTETYYREDGKPEGVPAELADVVIRCFDMADYYGIDLEAAIIEKQNFNKTRPYLHGKKF